MLGYLKALGAAAAAFLAALVQATQDGSGITPHEWLLAASFALGALGTVWGIPNGGYIKQTDVRREVEDHLDKLGVTSPTAPKMVADVRHEPATGVGTS